MNDGLVIDALNRLAHHEGRLEEILNRLYFSIQQDKAAETPGTVRINTVYVFQPSGLGSFQLVPNNPRRKRLILINNGADDLIFSFEPFHNDQINVMSSMLNATATPQAQVQGGIIVASGPNTVMETTSALHVLNFVKTGDAVGCALTYIEEVFLTPNRESPELAGLQGLLHQGYQSNGLKSIK